MQYIFYQAHRKKIFLQFNVTVHKTSHNREFNGIYIIVIDYFTIFMSNGRYFHGKDFVCLSNKTKQKKNGMKRWKINKRKWAHRKSLKVLFTIWRNVKIRFHINGMGFVRNREILLMYWTFCRITVPAHSLSIICLLHVFLCNEWNIILVYLTSSVLMSAEFIIQWCHAQKKIGFSFSHGVKGP